MAELEEEEAKLKKIVSDLHETMKEYRYAVLEGKDELAEEIYRKTTELDEKRTAQRKTVYRLRKEESKK